MTRVAGTQYSIGAPGRVCVVSGREFSPQERFVAVLAQSRETGEMSRLDYAEQAWNAGARPGHPLVVLGIWRATAGAAKTNRRLLIDDEELIELFRSTEAGAEPGGTEAEASARAGLRLVLALLLLRKRVLVHEGSKGTTMLVRVRGTPRPPEGPAYEEVADAGLDEATLARVTEQLGAVLADASGTGEAGGTPEKVEP